MKKALKKIPIIVLVYSLSCASILFSWKLLIATDFGYSVMYGLAGIEHSVELVEQLHKDKRKKNFSKTDKSEHIKLVGQIFHTIDSSGDNIKNIHYYVDGKKKNNLLMRNEIFKLKFMADSVFYVKIVIYVSMLFGLFAMVIMVNDRIPPSRMSRAIAVWSFLVVASLAGWYMVLYPVIFPENLAWIFDYKRSLLAPLFGSIGYLWYMFALMLSLSMVIFILLYSFVLYIFKINRGIN
jgi:hypothetical protein